MSNFGKFIENTAGYEINTQKLPTSWEYIYENRDILLKVDQFGPVYAQANPPGDVMLFKRENHEKYSPWHFRISYDGSSEEFSNFFKPNNLPKSEEAKNVSIRFLPECAIYSFEYRDLRVETELFIPDKGIEAVCKLRIKNLGKSSAKLNISAQLVPYFNNAQMTPWDKYEWYLDSTFKSGLFSAKLLSPDPTQAKKRYLYLDTNTQNQQAHELSFEKYVGYGDVFSPDKNYTNSDRVYAYPPIFASLYTIELAENEEKEITETLSVGTEFVKTGYDSLEIYNKAKKERKDSFDNLFSQNKVKTGDSEFDYYANYWLPIQMNWVASLDRGWPTGMRGSRDSAQDYTGLLYTAPDKCKSIILTMLECERTDGWFPRQYSAKGKLGKHDLREYVDSGAFFIEFIWKYLAHTNDFAILDEQVEWLDSDEKSTVLAHVLQVMEYYIKDENIGEHGLCKIREGDWLDAVNAAGKEGRGESVTVSCQTVMSLDYISDILKYLDENADISKYQSFKKELIANINKHAFNKKGFYNGAFNDNGQWIFSDSDPDGEERIYGVSNYYAIISGVADEKQRDGILEKIESLKNDTGYLLFSPYLGKTPIDKVGRIASGDVPPYFAENGNVYNHGSQGFLARAFASAGRGDKLYEALKWLMPYDTSIHPTELAYTPPYAIVNCYQQISGFYHRGLMYFLTGSIAMGVRGVYEWIFGVKPTLRGLEVSPCLADWMEDVSYDFYYLGKKMRVEIKNKEVYINGEKTSFLPKDSLI